MTPQEAARNDRECWKRLKRMRLAVRRGDVRLARKMRRDAFRFARKAAKR